MASLRERECYTVTGTECSIEGRASDQQGCVGTSAANSSVTVCHYQRVKTDLDAVWGL